MSNLLTEVLLALPARAVQLPLQANYRLQITHFVI